MIKFSHRFDWLTSRFCLGLSQTSHRTPTTPCYLFSLKRKTTVSQPTNQPTKQASNQASNQPTKQATNQPTKQPSNQATNQPTNRNQINLFLRFSPSLFGRLGTSVTRLRDSVFAGFTAICFHVLHLEQKNPPIIPTNSPTNQLTNQDRTNQKRRLLFHVKKTHVSVSIHFQLSNLPSCSHHSRRNGSSLPWQALAEATTPSFLSFAGAAINASVKEINLTDDVSWKQGGASGAVAGA